MKTLGQCPELVNVSSFPMKTWKGSVGTTSRAKCDATRGCIKLWEQSKSINTATGFAVIYPVNRKVMGDGIPWKAWREMWRVWFGSRVSGSGIMSGRRGGISEREKLEGFMGGGSFEEGISRTWSKSIRENWREWQRWPSKYFSPQWKQSPLFLRSLIFAGERRWELGCVEDNGWGEGSCEAGARSKSGRGGGVNNRGVGARCLGE